MLDNISVFHSSIRIEGSKVIYFDPFKIEGETHDADIIFITHDHFDHFSPEDIDKVYKDGTIIVVPESMEKNKDLGKYMIKVFVNPEDKNSIDDVTFKAIPAYNHLKPFHPKGNKWVGYVVTMDDTTYYVAGDTDITEEAKNVQCDVALLPCGGLYTMDYKEAAELANTINPTYAVPTHYGSVAGSSEDGKRFTDLLNADIEGVIKIK
jgi:L-ascorbate metabolism protein UlaG (beta-lactamase superfamily)